MRTGCLLLIVLLTGCDARPDRQTVRLVTAGSGLQTFTLPITLAQALGYYKDEGTEVDMQTLPSHAKTLQALVGGSVDVAGVAYPQIVQLAAEGQRVRAFFVVNRTDTKVLIVTPSASKRVHKVEDLKGANIGIPSPGSACHQFFMYYLGRLGIGPQDVSFISIGVSASAMAAVESGRIEAACLAGGDHFHVLQRHPDAQVLVDGSSPGGMRQSYGGPYYAGEVLVAKTEWIERNPDVARKLTRAVLRAQQWITTHTPEEIRARLPESLRSPDERLDREIIAWGRAGYTPDGAMPQGAPELVKRYVDSTVEHVGNAKIDLAATWTNDYLPERK